MNGQSTQEEFPEQPSDEEIEEAVDKFESEDFDPEEAE